MAPFVILANEGLEQATVEVFKHLDKDGNGYVSATELSAIMGQLGQPITIEQAEAMVKEADLDGDGHIAFNELMHIVHSA